MIGVTRTSVNALASKRQLSLPLINEKKRQKKGSKYKDSGVLHFLSVEVRREYTFLDFITSGLQLEFAVSVDFTSSNGQIHSLSSLHYLDPQRPNQYEMAIRSVLEICEHYNRSRTFEAVGFGAKVPPAFQQVSHLFPLNITAFDRRTIGVEGVLNAYRIALMNTQLYGPTNFSPTINEFAKKARQFPGDGSRYQILLIITDGIITDMQKTIAAIIAASDLPLSIIIVGVGNEDFAKMDALDCDAGLLTQDGRTARRDIVQFVPFRNFIGSSSPDGMISAQERAYVQAQLAKEVLAEVPEQVVGFMKSRGIAPLPPNAQPTQDFNNGHPPPSGPYDPNNGGLYPMPVLQLGQPQQPQLALDQVNLQFQQQLHVKSSAPPMGQ